MGTIRGYYPGGPDRTSDPEARRRRLEPVRTLWSRRSRKVVTVGRVRRRRRLLTGFAVMLLAAVMAGSWLGVRSHASAEEVAREVESAAVPDTPDARIRKEADRVLQELWRMEAMERHP